jgi:hypothetical protein
MPSPVTVIFCLEGKGVYGVLTVSKGQAASGFAKNLPLSRCLLIFHWLRASVFFAKTLTDLTPAPYSPRNKKTTDATDDAEDKKNVIDYGKQRKNIETKKLPPLWNQHKILVAFGGFGRDCRANIQLCRIFLLFVGSISRLQGDKACNAFNRTCPFNPVYGDFNYHLYSNYFIINILILTIMVQHLLFANKTYDTAKQAVEKNQVIQMEGYDYDRYIVHDVINGHSGLMYRLINLRTREFGQCDLIRPLSEKFGIGYYYNDAKPEFMDAFEVLALYSEAEYKAREEQEAKQKRRERNEQLKAIGRERLQKLIPEDAKAVIIAELHEDDSEPMTDYFSYHTTRTVILGFSNHTKDLFSEMRRYAANFEETAYLIEENKKYEHREKYTGGAGYYLGKSKYSGWTVSRERIYDRERFIERFALIAGEKSNVCIKAQVKSETTTTTAITGDFLMVDYSEKALAVFGDTKPIKNELKALGGRFNSKLTHDGEKKAGWIFSKNKENELNNLLTIK